MAYRTTLQGPGTAVNIQLTTTYEGVGMGDNRADVVTVYNPAASDVMYLAFEAKGALAPASTVVSWIVPAGSCDVVPVDPKKVDIFARMGATTTSNCFFRSHVVSKAGQ